MRAGSFVYLSPNVIYYGKVSKNPQRGKCNQNLSLDTRKGSLINIDYVDTGYENLD